MLFNNPTSSDAGRYQCNATYKTTISQTIDIGVTWRPKIIVSPRDTFVNAGNPVVLDCATTPSETAQVRVHVEYCRYHVIMFSIVIEHNRHASFYSFIYC